MQLPEDFLRQTLEIMGKERFERFMHAFDEDAPVSIRLNPNFVLPASAVLADRVAWCPSGGYLAGRPQFTFDPLFHGGCYYVQEAASMFLDEVLRQHLPQQTLSFLDLCAAPGGKSTLVRSALTPDSLLVSNEPVRKRAHVLAENLTKWGHDRTLVTNNRPEDFSRLRLMFDAILCDVPCSGEGMMRRDEAVVDEWSLDAVSRCSCLQRQIVGEAWQCLKPGGLLIYSTCTFNIKENEENVLWAIDRLGAQPLVVDTCESWAITGSLLPACQHPVYRFIPGITRSEGLFMAVLRKAGHEAFTTHAEITAKALADKVVKKLNIVANRLKTTPEPVVGTADVDYPAAISYLRGEALCLPPDIPRGLIDVVFMGRRLGQAKNIGTRANNLYPKEWRIRSSHVPEEWPNVLGAATSSRHNDITK